MRARDPAALVTEVFRCTGCAKCCRNLVDPASGEVPADWPALAAQGLYPLPRTGGLQVWPWERRRLLAAAARKGVPIAFAPALVAVGAPGTGAHASAHAGEEPVPMHLHPPAAPAPARDVAAVVVWEHLGAACPLVTADDRCGCYGERPVVCRSYPLLLRSGRVAVSALCPGRVLPERAEDLPAAYGDAHAAALAAGRYPQVVAPFLAFLETSKRFVRRRDLDPWKAAALPKVDLLDLLEVERVATQAEVEARCAGLGVAYA